MAKLLTVMCLLMLVACQPKVVEDQATQSCESKGGKTVWAKLGASCAMPTSDRGNSCSDSRQCQGLCLSNGQCSDHDFNPGCTDVLSDGVPVTLCID